MKSEFVMASTPIQDQGHGKLVQHGYRATCGNTFRGPTVTVEHEDAELGLVEEIVHAVDPVAERYDHGFDQPGWRRAGLARETDRRCGAA